MFAFFLYFAVLFPVGWVFWYRTMINSLRRISRLTTTDRVFSTCMALIVSAIMCGFLAAALVLLGLFVLPFLVVGALGWWQRARIAQWASRFYAWVER